MTVYVGLLLDIHANLLSLIRIHLEKKWETEVVGVAVDASAGPKVTSAVTPDDELGEHSPLHFIGEGDPLESLRLRCACHCRERTSADCWKWKGKVETRSYTVRWTMTQPSF